MSTRSFIGIHGEDNTIQGIYCHSDGYPSWNGRLLRDNYETATKIGQLMRLGDLSVLAEEIGEKHDFHRWLQSQEEQDKTANWCLAYGRDRGEKNTKAKTYQTEAEFLQGARDFSAEFAYLYRGGEWIAWDLHDGMSYQLWKGPKPLAEAVALDEAKQAVDEAS